MVADGLSKFMADLGRGLSAVSQFGAGTQKSAEGATQAFQHLGETAAKQAAKIDSLTDKLGLQQRALDIAKKELAAVSEKYGESSIQAEKKKLSVDRLASALNKTEQELENEKKALDTTNEALHQSEGASEQAARAIKDVGETADHTGSRFSAFGEIAIGALRRVGEIAVNALGSAASAVGGFLKDSISVAADFSEKMSGVQAVLQATPADAEKLRAAAIQMGRDTSFSASEAASAFEMLGQNGVTAAQILQGAGKATLDLAAAAGSDLTTAADVASTTMVVFKKNASELTGVIDGVTGVTILSKFGIDDYKLALAQGGGAAAAFGVDLQDFNTVITATSTLFSSGGDAGTSFKTFLTRLVPASKSAEAAMRDLGIITKEGANQFFNADGSMKSMADISGILQTALGGLSEEQKNAALTTIFGSDAMRTAIGLADTGKAKFGELSAQIANTSAAEQAKIRMDNLSGSLEATKGSLETLQITIGAGLEPVLKGALDNTVIPAINSFGDFAGTFLKLAPAITTAQDPFNTFINVLRISLDDSWNPLLATVQDVGNKFLGLVGPIGSGAQSFLNLLPTMQQVTQFIDGTVKPGILALASEAQKDFQAIQGVVDQVMPAVRSLIGTELAAITAFWNANGSDIVNSTSQAFQSAGSIIREVLGVIGPLISGVLTAIAGWFSANKDSIVTIVTGLWNVVKGLFTVAGAAISAVVTTATALMTGDWDAWRARMSSITSSLGDGLKSLVSGLFGVLTGMFGTSPAEMSRKWSDAWETIKSKVDAVAGPLKSTITEALAAAGTAFNTVKEKMDSVATSIHDKFTSLMGTVRGMGSDLMSGFAKGVGDNVGALVDAITGAANRALEAAKKALGISSPSKVFADQIGIQIPAGVQMGIKAGESTLEKAVSDMKSTLLTPLSNLKMPPLWSQSSSTPIMPVQVPNVVNNYGGNQTTYQMPIYTNQSPAVLQQSHAIMEAMAA